MFLENVRIALIAIWSNKMRSILTVLGIMIGVASVIAVVSLVQGLQYNISNQLESVGSTFIRVIPDLGVQRNPFLQKLPELTYDDALAVKKASSAVKEFTPLFMAQPELKNGDARHSSTMLGVNQAYQDVVNNWVDRGRFFTTMDEEAKKRVCVIGVEVGRKLALGDPLGKVIQIDGNAFTVVGVMEKKGGGITGDQDDVLFIPFTTAAAIYGTDRMKHLPFILQVHTRDEIDMAKDQVREVLRSRHHLKKGQKDDFQITTQEELMKAISSILLGVSGSMAGIVGIALIVGGIGIMNIMLVSVTERTREIGIRKSIGARRYDVLVQFLTEAVALSALGGIVGIVGGYGLANLARALLRKWVDLPPVHTPFWAIAIAFGFCGFLGVLFGIYPAAKASKLDPIEALRYE